MGRRDSLSDSSKEEYCYRCGRPGHFKVDCYAVTHRNGHPLPVEKRRRITPQGGSQAGVYVLKDSKGRVYVGKSADVKRRVEENKKGKGTTFLGEGIRQAAPLTKGSTDDLESWERNETLAQMRRQGVSRVQGWMFTGEVDRECAFRHVCEKFDLCRKCGRAGHFIDRCKFEARAAWAV